jgi:hypothetical protein
MRSCWRGAYWGCVRWGQEATGAGAQLGQCTACTQAVQLHANSVPWHARVACQACRVLILYTLSDSQRC